jgi:hypothetical protein
VTARKLDRLPSAWVHILGHKRELRIFMIIVDEFHIMDQEFLLLLPIAPAVHNRIKLNFSLVALLADLRLFDFANARANL